MTAVSTSSLHREVGLKLEKLLTPLAEGDGGGVDIRYTPAFDAVAEARREDIAEGSQGVWQTELKKGDWKAVIRLGTDILSKESKDLQVSVWMIQALVRLHGLKGLVAGLDFLTRLSETFWPVLYPRLDEEDPEVRLGPFFWLDSHMTTEMVLLEVSERTDSQQPAVTYQQIIKARQLRRLASNDRQAFEDAMADGEQSPDETEELMEACPDAYFQARHEETRNAVAALQALSVRLDELAGADSPSFARLMGALNDVERLFSSILHGRGLLAVSAAAEDEGEALDTDDDGDFDDADASWHPGEPVAGVPALSEAAGENGEPAGGDMVVAGGRAVAAAHGEAAVPAAAAGPIASRRAAYKVIDQAAEWLMRNEPHSPAPYLIKRAVSWENMTLRDVLAELLARGGDLETVMELLGMDSEGRPAGGKVRKSTSVSGE